MSEKYWTRILVILFVASLSVRFLFLWLFEAFDPSFLASNGSLIDGYLIPRLIVSPWKVDWSYGPLTYDLYWIVAHLPSNQIISRTINFLADAGTAYFVAVISRKNVLANRSWLTAVVWVFFPLSVFDSIVGQIDALPVFVTIAALYFATSRKPWHSFLLISLGFNLKLFPILLLPIIVWSFRRKLHLTQLAAGIGLPFILFLLLLPPTAALSGFNSSSIVMLMLQRFQSRTASGTSLLNLFEAQLPQAQILKQLLPTFSYLALMLLIAAIIFRKSDNPDYHLANGSALILFASVNLSIEVQTNYVLWYFPLILLAIMMETKKLYLGIQLSLLSLIVILNNLFFFARLTEITHDTITATPSLLDFVTIGGYQIGAWLLFILLWWRMQSRLKVLTTSKGNFETI